MNLEQLFCPNIDCPARGQVRQGNIGSHSQKEKRCHCKACDKSFAVTKGTLFYRLRTDPQTVMCVIVLLANGCPLQAVVKAFGFDERTVKNWWLQTGAQCVGVHNQLIGQSRLDLQQVQADEIKVKIQGGSIWMAMAMMVSTRLWLGGAVSAKRNQALITELVAQIRSIALCRKLLLSVDGLKSYVKAFQKVFRSPWHTGKLGRPKMVAWQEIVIVQVVKQKTAGHFSVQRRIVQGCQEVVDHLLQSSQGGGVINTAFIERLNATFRQRMDSLSRRNRCPAQQEATLTAGMYIVGCFYNFCDYHHSLRVGIWINNWQRHWVQMTPAMAAELTDHRWSPDELFWFKIPPPTWTPPKRRGRPSKQMLELIETWAL